MTADCLYLQSINAGTTQIMNSLFNPLQQITRLVLYSKLSWHIQDSWMCESYMEKSGR